MRKLDPFDEDDYEMMVQIAYDLDLPLRYLLVSNVETFVSDEETLFNLELENL